MPLIVNGMPKASPATESSSNINHAGKSRNFITGLESSIISLEMLSNAKYITRNATPIIVFITAAISMIRLVLYFFIILFIAYIST